jgi:hypothetical protein
VTNYFINIFSPKSGKYIDCSTQKGAILEQKKNIMKLFFQTKKGLKAPKLVVTTLTPV